jgi:hypothetical protein
MLRSIWELVVEDWRATRWKLFGLIYAVTLGGLLYFFSSFEMWYLSVSLGLTATVVALLLFAAMVTNFISLWHGLAVVAGGWTIAVVSTLGWIHGQDHSPQSRLFFLVACSVSTSYLIGLAYRIYRGLKEA